MQDIIGKSKAVRHLNLCIQKVSQFPSTVCIEGESGTGKELVARKIHMLSGRSPKRFISLNCAGFTESLIESELRGHKKGAFTNAVEESGGIFLSADKGTLFLDEIAEMPYHLQAKLLRIIQEREVVPLGSAKPVPVDVRFVVASNKDLKAEVFENRFRADLYYRLNVICIHLPPLKDRKEDIPLLVNHFFSHLTRLWGLEKQYGISEPALEKLMGYDFPGNIRELSNIIERAIAMSDSECIRPEDIVLPEDENEQNFCLSSCSKSKENSFRSHLRERMEKAFAGYGLRSISLNVLTDFLEQYSGGFFLHELAGFIKQHSKIAKGDKKKTARVYLKRMQRHNIIVHNGKSTNKSEYRLFKQRVFLHSKRGVRQSFE